MRSTKTHFFCVRCERMIARPIFEGVFGSAGYATKHNGKKVCFDCCAIEDMEYMADHGQISLYLDAPHKPGIYHARDGVKVNNWPATLSFTKGIEAKVRRNGHNWYGVRRTDVWFRGPDGHIWHGVQLGDMNQICRCKRTKLVWAHPLSTYSATYRLKHYPDGLLPKEI